MEGISVFRDGNDFIVVKNLFDVLATKKGGNVVTDSTVEILHQSETGPLVLNIDGHKVAICACGRSENTMFCDGSHAKPIKRCCESGCTCV